MTDLSIAVAAPGNSGKAHCCIEGLVDLGKYYPESVQDQSRMEEGARFLSEDGRQHWDEAWKKGKQSRQKQHHEKYKHGSWIYRDICTHCDVCYSQEKYTISIER
jgi:hypothetical protein